jgi:hypothetical protein
MNALDLRLYIYFPLSFFVLFNSILRLVHHMLDRRGKIKHYLSVHVNMWIKFVANMRGEI